MESIKHKNIYLFSLYSILLTTIFFACPDRFNSLPKAYIVLFGFTLYTSLYLISLVDFIYLRIPNIILITSTSLGFIFSFLNFFYLQYDRNYHIIINNISSALIFLISFASIKISGEFITQKNILGTGDVKLVFMIGIWLGLKGGFTALSISIISAFVYNLIRILIKKAKAFDPFPFGPFLCGGAWCVWITGSNWWGQKLQNLLDYLML